MIMTDELIKQNADAYARQFLEPYDEEYAPIKYVTAQMAHIAGAHSRDEEIKELEKKVSALKTVIVTARATISTQEAIIKDLRNPWISVKDRLPEKAKGLYKLEEDEHHKMVLFKTANGRSYIGYLDAEEIWRAFTVPYKGACPIDRFTWSRVANWMPMPKV